MLENQDPLRWGEGDAGDVPVFSPEAFFAGLWDRACGIGFAFVLFELVEICDCDCDVDGAGEELLPFTLLGVLDSKG
jgi:hypothetical protein